MPSPYSYAYEYSAVFEFGTIYKIPQREEQSDGIR